MPFTRSKEHSSKRPGRPNTAGLEHLPVDKVRDITGDLCNRATFGRERIVITRHGSDAAAIVGLEDLAFLLEHFPQRRDERDEAVGE